MPRIRGYTPDQKAAHDYEVQRRRIRNIIYGYMEEPSVKFLAAVTGIKYTQLQQRITGNVKWDVPTLTKVFDTLDVPMEDRAKALGWTEKKRRTA